jgi:hypothetical protein
MSAARLFRIKSLNEMRHASEARRVDSWARGKRQVLIPIPHAKTPTLKPLTHAPLCKLRRSRTALLFDLKRLHNRPVRKIDVKQFEKILFYRFFDEIFGQPIVFEILESRGSSRLCPEVSYKLQKSSLSETVHLTLVRRKKVSDTF